MDNKRKERYNGMTFICHIFLYPLQSLSKKTPASKTACVNPLNGPIDQHKNNSSIIHRNICH